MDSERARRVRAEARRGRATLRRGTLERYEHELQAVTGAEAISLVTRLTVESWSLTGREVPQYARQAIPCRFVPGRLT